MDQSIKSKSTASDLADAGPIEPKQPQSEQPTVDREPVTVGKIVFHDNPVVDKKIEGPGRRDPGPSFEARLRMAAGLALLFMAFFAWGFALGRISCDNVSVVN